MGPQTKSEYPHNPNHAIGTCANCGEEMVFNVPRLGPGGGYIHKSTGNFQCKPTSASSASGIQQGGQKMTYGWDHGKFVLLVQGNDDSLIARISMNPDEAGKVAAIITRPDDQRVFVYLGHEQIT